MFDRTRVREVLERAAGPTVVLTNKTPLPGTVLRQLPELRYIGVLATGYNIVDVAAARELGIVVTNIPTYGTASVAQFVFALLLELCHNVRTARGRRAGRRMDPQPRLELLEIAAGGTGGEDHGDRRVRAHRPADGAHRGRHGDAGDRQRYLPRRRARLTPASDGRRWRRCSRESDVVSLHSPLLPETRGMINARSLALMKPSALPDQHLARAAGGGSGPGGRARTPGASPAPAWTCFRWSRRPSTIRCSRRATAWSRRTSRGPPGRPARG